MSFKFGRFAYLAISIIIGSFFLLMGIFGIALPWSFFLQQVTTQLIIKNTLILSLFGLGFVLVGLSIILYAILSSRRRYMMIQTGPLSVRVDENVIYQYLETYWQEHFPKSSVSFNLTFHKHSLQIVADLPALPLDEQKQFLEKVRQDFIELFGHLLGYSHEVQLIANFQTEKTN